MRHRHMVNIENEQECRTFLLNRFGIELPSDVSFVKTKNQGLRIYSKSIDEKGVSGLKGFACFSLRKGLNNFLIQQFGHLARKNIIALNHDDAVNYLLGKPLSKKLKLEDGYVIVAYKGHILGLGRFEKGTLFSRLKGIRRHEIVDDIKSYPHRNL